MSTGAEDLLRSKHFIPMLEMLKEAHDSKKEGMMVSDFFVLTSSQTTIKHCLALMSEAGAVECSYKASGRKVPIYNITERGVAMLDAAINFNNLVTGEIKMD